MKTITQSLKNFIALPLWRNPNTLLVIWILLAVVSTITKYQSSDNNYLIYKYVFYHVIEQKDLYAYYPNEFADLNQYGPFFSYVIAPFAALPRFVGLLLWNIALTLLLYFAIKTSRFSRYEVIFMLWYSTHDLLTCLFMQQFNIAVAALILLSFTMVEQKKDFWSAFFICAGVFVKLLGIVGIVFFFFSHNKKTFVASLLFWSAVMFVAPMLISSPEYIIGQYASWYEALISKNGTNTITRYVSNNVSLIGLFQRPFIEQQLSALWVIIPGLVVAAAGFFRINQWRNLPFRKMILADVLLFVILFSTGTENSSYVIAYVGLAIWYASVPWKRSNWDIALMVFAFVFGSLSPTDLYPSWLRHEVIAPFSLRALPVALIWFKLSYELITKNYNTKSIYADNTIQ